MKPIAQDCFLQLDIKKFILQWNAKYPMDKYIRKKYGIQFGSPEHRALNLIDMTIEYAEDKLLALEEEKSMRLNERDYEKVLGIPQPKTDENQPKQKFVKMTKKQVDEEFENIDLSQFND